MDKTSPSSSTSEEVVRSKTEITIPLKTTCTVSEQVTSEKVNVKGTDSGEEVEE